MSTRRLKPLPGSHAPAPAPAPRCPSRVRAGPTLTCAARGARVAAARPGERVRRQAAAGGGGLAVAEVGKSLQLRVIGLCSAAKHEVLRRYGVEPLDGRDPRWPEAVRRAAPGGVDVILDAVGGDSWRQGYRLLAPGGRLVCFGASTLSRPGGRHLLAALWQLLRFPRFGPLALMSDNRAVAGVNIGHLWDRDAMMRPQIAALLRYAADGRIKPRVDRAFPLADAAAANRYIQERKNVGKVVLVST